MRNQTTQILDDELKKIKNSASDKRIEELKKQLKKVHKDYYKKVYYILKEILQIRKQQMKGYGESKLSTEKGINLTCHQISYIFGYRFVSTFTLKEIEKGRLKVSTALIIIKQNIKFREPTYQNKVVKMYLDGKLKTTEIGRVGAETILSHVISGKEISLANKQLIHYSFYTQEMMKTINSKRNLFSDEKILRYLKGQMKRFSNLLADTDNFKYIKFKTQIDKFTKTLKKLELDNENRELLHLVKTECDRLSELLEHIEKFGENVKRTGGR